MSVNVYKYQQAYITVGGETRYKKITMTYKKEALDTEKS